MVDSGPYGRRGPAPEQRRGDRSRWRDGEIGEAGFRRFVNLEVLRDLPMVLETPVDGKGYAWNVERCCNLREAV